MKISGPVNLAMNHEVNGSWKYSILGRMFWRVTYSSYMVNVGQTFHEIIMRERRRVKNF